MSAAEQIKQIEQQIRQRIDQLAAADAVCNRLLGRLDVLKEQAKTEAAAASPETKE